MKLPNVCGCLPLHTGGNSNRQTKLVEVRRTGLRTWVRLPSGPLRGVRVFLPGFFLVLGKIDNIHARFFVLLPLGKCCYGDEFNDII